MSEIKQECDHTLPTLEYIRNGGYVCDKCREQLMEKTEPTPANEGCPHCGGKTTVPGFCDKQCYCQKSKIEAPDFGPYVGGEAIPYGDGYVYLPGGMITNAANAGYVQGVASVQGELKEAMRLLQIVWADDRYFGIVHTEAFNKAYEALKKSVAELEK